YWRKHRALVAALVYRALVAAGMALRLAVLPLPSRLPGSRRQAVRAYLRVLIAATGLSRGFQLSRAQEVATLAPAAPRPFISRLPGGPNGPLASLSLSAVAGARLLAKSGPLAFSRRLWDRITGRPPRPIDDPLLAGYPGWWAREVGSTAGKEREPGRGASLTSAPTFSVIMPVFNPPLRFLREAIASVRAQTYPQWELVVADDGSQREVLDELRRLAADEPRVRLAANGQTHGISTATNRALGVARGDWVGFVDHDDLLAPTAISEVAAALARQPALDALYTDRDSIDERGYHLAPYFKPDWSPHALLSHNYAIHFLVVRRDLLERLGGLRSAFDGAQDYDLLLRLAEATDRVGHLPRVVYSWRRHAASNLGTPRPEAFAAGRRAIADAVARRGLSGRVELSAPAGPYRTRLEPRGEPLVSVIVSSRTPELLESCFVSLRSRTHYPRIELLLATNKVGHAGLAAVCAANAAEIVEVEDGFFSLMNNAAAGRARGEMLVFLNDDTRIETPDWIEAMLGTLELPGVAAVGPKLVYPNGRVQFTRVVMGIRADGVPYFFDPFDHYGLPYLFGFSLDVATEVSSVSGGCMMVRREEFLDSGGFPAGELATSYQDVSWSLGMRRRGRSIIYTPQAAVTHWGSFSKKQDDRLLEREIRIATLFFSSHQAELDRPDPFWNPNLLEAGGFMEPPRFPGLPRFSRRGM
ncbi:MAG: glycosyltransferase, partial [Thermoanaerobaculales bacterium]